MSNRDDVGLREMTRNLMMDRQQRRKEREEAEGEDAEGESGEGYDTNQSYDTDDTTDSSNRRRKPYSRGLSPQEKRILSLENELHDTKRLLLDCTYEKKQLEKEKLDLQRLVEELNGGGASGSNVGGDEAITDRAKMTILQLRLKRTEQRRMQFVDYVKTKTRNFLMDVRNLKNALKEVKEAFIDQVDRMETQNTASISDFEIILENELENRLMMTYEEEDDAFDENGTGSESPSGVPSTNASRRMSRRMSRVALNSRRQSAVRASEDAGGQEAPTSPKGDPADAQTEGVVKPREERKKPKSSTVSKKVARPGQPGHSVSGGEPDTRAVKQALSGARSGGMLAAISAAMQQQSAKSNMAIISPDHPICEKVTQLLNMTDDAIDELNKSWGKMKVFADGKAPFIPRPRRFMDPIVNVNNYTVRMARVQLVAKHVGRLHCLFADLSLPQIQRIALKQVHDAFAQLDQRVVVLFESMRLVRTAVVIKQKNLSTAMRVFAAIDEISFEANRIALKYRNASTEHAHSIFHHVGKMLTRCGAVGSPAFDEIGTEPIQTQVGNCTSCSTPVICEDCFRVSATRFKSHRQAFERKRTLIAEHTARRLQHASNLTSFVNDAIKVLINARLVPLQKADDGKAVNEVLRRPQPPTSDHFFTRMRQTASERELLARGPSRKKKASRSTNVDNPNAVHKMAEEDLLMMVRQTSVLHHFVLPEDDPAKDLEQRIRAQKATNLVPKLLQIENGGAPFSEPKSRGGMPHSAATDGSEEDPFPLPRRESQAMEGATPMRRRSVSGSGGGVVEEQPARRLSLQLQMMSPEQLQGESDAWEKQLPTAPMLRNHVFGGRKLAMIHGTPRNAMSNTGRARTAEEASAPLDDRGLQLVEETVNAMRSSLKSPPRTARDFSSKLPNSRRSRSRGRDQGAQHFREKGRHLISTHLPAMGPAFRDILSEEQQKLHAAQDP